MVGVYGDWQYTPFLCTWASKGKMSEKLTDARRVSMEKGGNGRYGRTKKRQ